MSVDERERYIYVKDLKLGRYGSLKAPEPPSDEQLAAVRRRDGPTDR